MSAWKKRRLKFLKNEDGTSRLCIKNQIIYFILEMKKIKQKRWASCVCACVCVCENGDPHQPIIPPHKDYINYFVNRRNYLKQKEKEEKKSWRNLDFNN